jgi:hypothetical protein
VRRWSSIRRCSFGSGPRRCACASPPSTPARRRLRLHPRARGLRQVSSFASREAATGSLQPPRRGVRHGPCWRSPRRSDRAARTRPRTTSRSSSRSTSTTTSSRSS